MMDGWFDRLAGAVRDLAGEARCPWCLRISRTACDRCAAGLTPAPPAQDPGWAPFAYAGAVAERIRALKFRGDLGAAQVLGEALAERLLTRGGERPALLIPVPLHRARLWRRGYNQALELARVVGPHLGVRVDHRCARRVRATAEQTHLDAAGRRRNLRGAFTVDPSVAGRHVALLDDVVTTGATLAALAAAARAAGAARVEAWAVARTP